MSFPHCPREVDRAMRTKFLDTPKLSLHRGKHPAHSLAHTKVQHKLFQVGSILSYRSAMSSQYECLFLEQTFLSILNTCVCSLHLVELRGNHKHNCNPDQTPQFSACLRGTFSTAVKSMVNSFDFGSNLLNRRKKINCSDLQWTRLDQQQAGHFFLSVKLSYEVSLLNS